MNEISDKEFIRSCKKKYTDFTNTMEWSGRNLVAYWLLFIEMNQLLLNITFAARSDGWELLLESWRNVVSYAFVYGNVYYTRYLTIILSKMLQLEDTHAEIYCSFIYGKVSVQLSERNTFHIYLTRILTWRSQFCQVSQFCRETHSFGSKINFTR